MLWLYQRTFYGEITHDLNRHLPDVNLRERISMFPLVAMAIIMGLFSPYWMQAIDPSSRLINGAWNPAIRATNAQAMPSHAVAVPSQITNRRSPISR